MSDRAIREAVQYLAGTHHTDKVSLFDATVDSVDPDARTCDCTAIDGSSGNPIPGARLMATVDDGVLILPAVGSTVTVLVSIFCDPIIVSYSEVDKIVFRGGDLGGLPLAGALTTKLNNLEKALNDLIAKYNSHTHNVTAVGAPTGPSLAPETNSLTLTQVTDIENTAIKQG